MKVIWSDESDYDKNGNPRPEAIKRALEYRKPLPWWRVLAFVWVLPGLVVVGFGPLIGKESALTIGGCVFAFVFLWANSAPVRGVTRRFLGWLVP